MDTYLITEGVERLDGSEHRVIRCLICGTETSNKYQIRYLHCAKCNRYHREPEGFGRFVQAITDSIIEDRARRMLVALSPAEPKVS